MYVRIARFTDNPHTATSSKRDLEPAILVLQITFSIPLPSRLPRSAPFPKAYYPYQTLSALSLRRPHGGARPRRRERPTHWLGKSPVAPNPAPGSRQQFPGCEAVGEEGFRDVECSPQGLVWRIENDPWVQHVVHRRVRYHNVVSFGHANSTPHLYSMSGLAACATLATTPPTDLAFSSLSSHDSDVPPSISDAHSIGDSSGVLSEADLASDPDLPAHRHHQGVASDADAEAEIGSGTDAGGGASDCEQVTEVLSLANDDETPRRA
ncbi:hypothetical protein EI94DRAFT_1810274 [Lactarius quietus]|nr:hypothetical protein EI94DRAFT_1810274 [Lactarius quietus]